MSKYSSIFVSDNNTDKINQFCYNPCVRVYSSVGSERFIDIEEVRGSSPLRLTKFTFLKTNFNHQIL